MYVMIYLLRGDLPWKGKKKNDPAYYDKILKDKMMTEPSKLCKGFPREFVIIMEYIRN